VDGFLAMELAPGTDVCFPLTLDLLVEWLLILT
jgi:hypothetical protein